MAIKGTRPAPLSCFNLYHRLPHRDSTPLILASNALQRVCIDILHNLAPLISILSTPTRQHTLGSIARNSHVRRVKNYIFCPVFFFFPVFSNLHQPAYTQLCLFRGQYGLRASQLVMSANDGLPPTVNTMGLVIIEIWANLNVRYSVHTSSIVD